MPRPPLRLALAAALALAGRPAGAFTLDEAKAPMTATLVRDDAAGCGADCPEWLALTGRIGFETPAVLRAALARIGSRTVPVLLDSPGGESTAALAMGRMIRARGLDTAVASTTLSACGPDDRACADRRRSGVLAGHVGTGGAGVATCASACVFVLAGGARRDVPASASVGVHQAMRIVTTHPRTGFWRILSRIVGGRRVEVSRTLVITRVLPDRVVKGAAPESLYAEFGRYLAGMGVDASIMPLMRATPPSGIHWMSEAEIVGTRIATDGADATELVRREAASQAAAGALRIVPAPAALTMDDGRRWIGAVRWRIDASAPATPVLAGAWEVPGRRLAGAVLVSAEAADASAAFRLAARLQPAVGPDALPLREVDPPQLCDLTLCMPTLSGAAAFDRPSAGFDVRPAWRDSFLGDLRRRDWLTFRVRTDEGWGVLALTLSSPDGEAIAAWERACCGVDGSDARWAAPATPLPALPAQPSAFVLPGLRPVDPVDSAAPPPPRTLPLQALLDTHPAREGSAPVAARGSVQWTALSGSRSVDGGAAVLLADVELPAAGFKAWIDVRASPPGALGRLTLSVYAATDGAVFGAPVAMTALHDVDARGHPLLFADAVRSRRTEGDRQAFVDIPSTGPIAGAIQLGFADAAHRRLTVAVPVDGAVAGILQATSRWRPSGGS